MRFFILASLVASTFAAGPVNYDCTTGDGDTLKVTPQGTACKDTAPEAVCKLTFGEEVPKNGRHDKCSNPALKKAAYELCPKYCGFCCKTKEYDCENTPGGLECEKLADKCADPTWKPLIIDRCPNVCGLCLLKEDNTGCKDLAPGCETQKALCNSKNPMSEEFMKKNCAKTCNNCGNHGNHHSYLITPDVPEMKPRTNPAAVQDPSCQDTRENCQYWIYNTRGKFCTNPYNINNGDVNKCRKSCGLC